MFRPRESRRSTSLVELLETLGLVNAPLNRFNILIYELLVDFAKRIYTGQIIVFRSYLGKFNVSYFGRVLLGLFRNRNTRNRRYLCSIGSYSVFGMNGI